MDIFEIRRSRLKLLIDEIANGNQTEFAAKTNIKAPQINRWISATATDRRNITEASAKKLEDATGKPNGWLSGHPTSETQQSGYPLPESRKIFCSEPTVTPYTDADPNIQMVISIMKRLDTKYQEKIVFAAELAEAESNRQKHQKRTG